jgi:hypothetical protein
MSKTNANRLIQSSEVIENLTPIGVIEENIILPTSERQVRPLTVLEPGEQVEVWQEIVEEYEPEEITAKKD